MFFRRFFIGAFLALLAFGALGMARHSSYDAAYRDGFAAGQRAAATSGESSGAKGNNGSETAVPPQANDRGQANERGQRMDHGDRHFGHDRGSFGWGFFPLAFLIGGFFKFALLALIIGGLFKFFGWGGPWRHHHKGHRPPWARHRKEDEASSADAPGAEKSPEDVEPDIKIG
ncbi:MAG: hypothetical protein R3C62_17655 [Chloroflexota bacterium]